MDKFMELRIQTILLNINCPKFGDRLIRYGQLPANTAEPADGEELKVNGRRTWFSVILWQDGAPTQVTHICKSIGNQHVGEMSLENGQVS